MKRALSITLTSLIGVLGCAAQAPLNSGVISGALTGDDHTAIAGGRVTLILLLPPPQSRPRQPQDPPRQSVWFAISGAGGSFRFTGLSVGTYEVCAQVPGTLWLNPCEWGLQPPAASLSDAQPTVNVTMVLKKGIAVPIRINDPGKILDQNEGKTPGAHLRLGVRNDAAGFQTAPIVSKDQSGRFQQIIIPFNANVNLVAQSSFFHLLDSNGTPLPGEGPSVPVAVAPGQQPSPITLTVAGGGH